MSPMMKLFFLAKFILSLSSGVCGSSATMLATTTTEIDDKDGNVLLQEYHEQGVRRQPHGKEDDEEDELPEDIAVVAGDEVQANFKKDEMTPNPSSPRPTVHPSFRPTFRPTMLPTSRPTFRPTMLPTSRPTSWPTVLPTSQPTSQPTVLPTFRPTVPPTFRPTFRPTLTFAPTAATPGGICTFTTTTTTTGLPIGSTIPLTFNNIQNAAGVAVTIRGDVNGDFGGGGIDGDETATYRDENGNQLLLLGNIGTDCISDRDSTRVSAAVFNTWNLDAAVTFAVTLSVNVNVAGFCGTNFVSVTLTYAC
jgi:hypothetical protein